jgi:NodT family efflux transporter outer membrane factor (OMF) lipoprotein
MKIVIFFLSCLLAACTVGPNYKPPALNYSNQWTKNKKNISAQPINITWWKSFHDPVLEFYLNKAITNNYDLKIAYAKIEQARAMRAMQASNLYPHLNANVQAVSLRLSQQGKELGFVSNLFDVARVDRQRPYYNLGFDASWEMDIFGQNKRAVEAEDRYVESVIEEKRDVLLTLLAEVARNYVEIRNAQQQITLAKEKISIEEKILTLIKKQNSVGTTNNLEVEQEQRLVHDTKALLPNLQANYHAALSEIAILIGEDPNSIVMDAKKGLPKIPRAIPLGLRSDILRRRPDVRKAEKELAKATAEMGVAIADLYPKFTLDVNPALQSIFFNKLFNSTSGAWSMGPFMTWNIFDAGLAKANIKNKQEEAHITFLNYQNTILSALKDTEDALTRFNDEKISYQDYLRALRSEQENTLLSKQRYQNGEDDLLALLASKKQLNQAQTDLLNSQTKTLDHLISLYKALGGGWENYEMSRVEL